VPLIGNYLETNNERFDASTVNIRSVTQMLVLPAMNACLHVSTSNNVRLCNLIWHDVGRSKDPPPLPDDRANMQTKNGTQTLVHERVYFRFRLLKSTVSNTQSEVALRRHIAVQRTAVRVA
jgi:hypothetical protein